MSDIERLGAGNPDGCLHGLTATEKIGFYGKTPIVQPAVIAQLTPASETTTSLGTCVNSILTDLKALGIIASA